MFAKGEERALRRRRRSADTDLDITPMIDVTFLLLIFFMVTSTMKPVRDRDIPPAVSGDSAVVENYRELAILSPASPGSESQVLFEGRPVTFEKLRDELQQQLRGGPVRLMIYAERDVRNGFVGEVESVINEVDGDVEYKFAVQDRR